LRRGGGGREERERTEYCDPFFTIREEEVERTASPELATMRMRAKPKNHTFEIIFNLSNYIWGFAWLSNMYTSLCTSRYIDDISIIKNLIGFCDYGKNPIRSSL